MKSSTLKHFSNLDLLKKLDTDLLKILIGNFSEYFNKYDIQADEALNYEQLKLALMNNDNKEMPENLTELLHKADEMSTETKSEHLKHELEDRETTINSSYTPLDIALYCQLYHFDIFERSYILSYLYLKRSFFYFKAKSQQNGEHKIDTEKQRLLESTLNEWHHKKKNIGHVKSYIYNKNEHTTWIAFTYAAPMKREGKVTPDGQSESIFYHPERTDLVIYDRKHHRLQIQTKSNSKFLREEYCRVMGLHLFKDETYFQSTDKPFTFMPLSSHRETDYDWTQVDGIKSIRLTEIQFRWGDILETHKITSESDYFPELAKRNISRSTDNPLPIVAANFQVKFNGQSKERSLSITPYKASFVRNEDTLVIDNWFVKHGFYQ